MIEVGLLLVLGLLVLAKSADMFVDSAVSFAHWFKIHPLIVGMVVLGFATAMPEVMVSALAASKGQLGMSVGNAVGSSIANIGLVVGGAALVVPLSVYSQMVKHEYPALFLSMLLVFFLVLDRSLDFIDGIILLLAFMLAIFWLVALAKKRRNDSESAVRDWDQMHGVLSLRKAFAYFLFGLLGLFIGSELLVDNATQVARYFGISDFVIGLTIVAIGTSLPELAASIVAARRGQHDIAIGNVVGSNLFNMLVVLAMPALIFPGPIPEVLLWRDMPTMFGMSLLMFLMSYGWRRSRGEISRLEGGCLFIIFAVYLALVGYWFAQP